MYSRKGADLKVISSVETKNPGYVTRDLKEKTSESRGFGVDQFYLRDEDVASLQNRWSSTRFRDTR